MASLISQMRNEAPTTMRQPSQQQAQLSQSIEQVRGMMQQLKYTQNPRAMITQMLQNNPALMGILKNNTNLESVAKQMAQANGININQLINQLQGGL